MQNILFIDIETNPKSKSVDYGAVFNGKELHERNIVKLEQWVKAAKYICGLDKILKEEKKNIIAKMNFIIQYEYVSFVRALLSDAAIELMFLNMLYWVGLKFKP